jgi:hypothetical protein
VSSGLAVFKRSTKSSLKVFNSLLSHVSESGSEDFGQVNTHTPISMRQSTDSYIAEPDVGAQGNESYQPADESISDQRMCSSSPEPNSIFSRLFNWKQPSSENKSTAAKLSNEHERCDIQKKSISEEELLAFVEKNPSFEGTVPLPSMRAQSQLLRLFSFDDTKSASSKDNSGLQKNVPSINQEHMNSFSRNANLERTLSQKQIENWAGEPATERKLGYRSSWYSKCSLSFSYGEEMGERSSGTFHHRKNNKPRYEPLHIKLHRYKTIHGSSRTEPSQSSKKLPLHNLHLVQVLQHFICCAPFLFKYLNFTFFFMLYVAKPL